MSKYLSIFTLILQIYFCTHAWADVGQALTCESQNPLAHSTQNSDNIRHCVNEFINDNEGANFIPKHEDCNFLCSFKSSLLTTLTPNQYAEFLALELGLEKINLIEHHQGYTPLEERVENLFKAFQPSFSTNESPQSFEQMRFIIFEIVKIFIYAQVEDLGVDLSSNNHNDVNVNHVENILDELSSCLEISKTDQHIEICVSKFQENAPYKVGELLLNHNLNLHFKIKFQNEDFNSIKDEALREYAFCSVTNYFNESNKSVEKITSCVYSSLITAFIKASGHIISNHIINEGLIFKNEHKSFLLHCENAHLFDESTSERYKEFESLSPEDFQTLLSSCQKTISEQSLIFIGQFKILNHESVIRVVPEDERVEFSKNIITKGVDECTARLPENLSVDRCENYILAITSQELLSKILTEKIESYLEDFPFLENLDTTKIIADGVGETRACNNALYEADIEWFLNLSSEEVERALADCIKVGVVTSLDSPVFIYINEELDQNEVLRINNITFELEARLVIHQRFNSCVSENLSAENGFSSILETSETFLQTCITETVKNVSLDSLHLILQQKLRSLGLSQTQATNLIENYKNSDENIISRIENAESDSEIKTLLLLAENEIMNSLDADIIRFLILEKSPISFSSSQLDSMVIEGERVLSNCVTTKPLSECSTETEKSIMSFGVSLFLPQAITEEVSEKLLPYLGTNYEERRERLQGLRLQSLFQRRLHTRDGQNLVREIVNEINSGKEIDQIKEHPLIKEFVYNSLSSSEPHMVAVSTYMIQPQINNNIRRSIGRFVFSGRFTRATQWTSIHKTSHGQTTMNLFKQYMRAFIVEGQTISIDTISDTMKPHIRRAMFEYENIIQEECPRGVSTQECTRRLNHVDENL